MKALTILQPYAHLIVTPQGELPPGQVEKRCENRSWETYYRGPVLIHAGKSRDMLTPAAWPHMCAGMPLGFLVGVAWLEDCFAARRVAGEVGGPLDQLQCAAFYRRKYMQLGLDLDQHVHCEGPFCWMLGWRRRFAEPIRYSGAQGLFEVPDSLVEVQLRACGFPEQLWTPIKPNTGKRLAKGPAF